MTLTFDDPGVSDEASIPSFNYTRSGANGGTGPSHEVDLGLEYDKTITPTTAIILNDGYDVVHTEGANTQGGWENLVITGKWQALTNAPHEAVVSLGVIREIGGTGTNHVNGDRFGATTPTVYGGKGMGDVPVDWIRPFAVTGRARLHDRRHRAQAGDPARHRGPARGRVQRRQQQRLVRRGVDPVTASHICSRRCATSASGGSSPT